MSDELKYGRAVKGRMFHRIEEDRDLFTNEMTGYVALCGFRPVGNGWQEVYGDRPNNGKFCWACNQYATNFRKE